jgi:hypothetical protein
MSDLKNGIDLEDEREKTLAASLPQIVKPHWIAHVHLVGTTIANPIGVSTPGKTS